MHEEAVNLTSGYVQRALATLPRQGSHKPWREHQNYVKDIFNYRLSRLNDGAMRYRRSGTASPVTAARCEAVRTAEGSQR